MKTKYKAILFDLDGTLLDTAPDLIAACNYTLDRFGYRKLDEKIIRTRITAGMREMMKLGVPEKEWDSAGIESVMRDCFAEYYTAHICDRTTEFHGIGELIQTLHKSGIKTAVITNKYYAMAKKVLSKFEFSKNFELILGCDSLTHSKPHPEPILKALEILKIKSEDALYVGDHLNDIRAAIAAKTDSVAVLWGYGQNECADIDSWGATYKAQDVEHLKSIIFC